MKKYTLLEPLLRCCWDHWDKRAFRTSSTHLTKSKWLHWTPHAEVRFWLRWSCPHQAPPQLIIPACSPHNLPLYLLSHLNSEPKPLQALSKITSLLHSKPQGFFSALVFISSPVVCDTDEHSHRSPDTRFYGFPALGDSLPPFFVASCSAFY